jgi:hypothetical protein
MKLSRLVTLKKLQKEKMKITFCSYLYKHCDEKYGFREMIILQFFPGLFECVNHGVPILESCAWNSELVTIGIEEELVSAGDGNLAIKQYGDPTDQLHRTWMSPGLNRARKVHHRGGASFAVRDAVVRLDWYHRLKAVRADLGERLQRAVPCATYTCASTVLSASIVQHQPSYCTVHVQL